MKSLTRRVSGGWETPLKHGRTRRLGDRSREQLHSATPEVPRLWQRSGQCGSSFYSIFFLEQPSKNQLAYIRCAIFYSRFSWGLRSTLLGSKVYKFIIDVCKNTLTALSNPVFPTGLLRVFMSSVSSPFETHSAQCARGFARLDSWIGALAHPQSLPTLFLFHSTRVVSTKDIRRPVLSTAFSTKDAKASKAILRIRLSHHTHATDSNVGVSFRAKRAW